MAKQKEIKFRDRGYVLEGRRGNLTFAMLKWLENETDFFTAPAS